MFQNLCFLTRSSGFSKIFERHKQHPETFPIFFSQMFVVHFVGFSQTPKIPVVCFIEPFETTVYQHIVH